jgi:hypothetical protein
MSPFPSTASRPALGPTQPPFQWAPGAGSYPYSKADHSPLSSAEVKNARSYASTPNIFMAWCLIKHRDTFTSYVLRQEDVYRCGYRASRTFDIGTRWNGQLRPPYPQGKSPHYLLEGWLGGPVWTHDKRRETLLLRSNLGHPGFKMCRTSSVTSKYQQHLISERKAITEEKK